MTIEEFLKTKSFNARLSVRRGWLIWDEVDEEWEVLREYRNRGIHVYRGKSLADALVQLEAVETND